MLLTTLATVLLLAFPVAAQPPGKLTDHITDSNHVLTDSGRAAVSSAIDRLYRDRHIQLWVAYVDNFSNFKPENWADHTRSDTGMGDDDALLAVATNTKSSKTYTFTLPRGVSANELNSLQRNQIEPAVNAKDWTAAAVGTADALNTSASAPSRNWLPIVIAVVAAVLLLVLVFLFLRARRRRTPGPGPGAANIGGRDLPLDQALARADARLHQITDYVARHHKNVGAEAQKQFAEAKRHLAAAHDKQATNATDAIAHANAASTLAAKAQTLANADVLKAHRGK
nr:TPM domain-containing protein [Mycobacterium asiaticum]